MTRRRTAARSAGLGRASARAAALVGVSTLLAGCGGSGSHESGYVAQASGICQQELARLKRKPQPTTPAQAVSYLPDAILIIRREAIRLQALTPPPVRRDALNTALGSARELAAVLNHFLLALKGGTVELSTFAQVQARSEALRDQINRQFRRAGLPRCAQS